jgi:hypothetical protein
MGCGVGIKSLRTPAQATGTGLQVWNRITECPNTIENPKTSSDLRKRDIHTGIETPLETGRIEVHTNRMP